MLHHQFYHACDVGAESPRLSTDAARDANRKRGHHLVLYAPTKRTPAKRALSPIPAPSSTPDQRTPPPTPRTPSPAPTKRQRTPLRPRTPLSLPALRESSPAPYSPLSSAYSTDTDDDTDDGHSTDTGLAG